MSDISPVLPCPFCGGKCDPIGWYANDSLSGPECKECGAAASSVENWNRRVSTVAPGELSEVNLVIGWIVEQLQESTIISRHGVPSRQTEPTLRLINLFCNAVYNLENMPLSKAWAAEFSMEGRQLLEQNDYFRNLPTSQPLQNCMAEPKASVSGHSDLLPVQSAFAWMVPNDQGTEPDITRNKTLAASWHFDKRRVIPLYTSTQEQLLYETSIFHQALLAIKQVANVGSPEMEIANKALTVMKNQPKSQGV